MKVFGNTKGYATLISDKKTVVVHQPVTTPSTYIYNRFEPQNTLRRELAHNALTTYCTKS